MSVTKAIKAEIRRPYRTIGEMEAMAGIPADEASRRSFWKAREAEVRDRTGVADPAVGLVVERAREVCYGLIEWRVSKDELCVLG